jgi:ABC-type multidrug transport system fused ATPase/permease subunit
MDVNSAGSRSLLDSAREALAILPARLRRAWVVVTAILAAAAFTELLTTTAIFALIASLGGDGKSSRLIDLTARFLPSAAGDRAIAALLFIAGIMGLKNVILTLASAHQARVTADSITAAFERLVGGWLAAPGKTRLDRSTSDLSHQASRGIEITYRIFLQSAVNLVMELLVALSLAISLFALIPLPALLVLVVVGGGVFLTLRGSARAVKRWAGETEEAERARLGDLQNILGGVREIRTLQREQTFLDRAFASNRRFVEGLRAQLALHGYSRVINEMIFVVVAVTLFLLARSRELPPATVLAMLGAFAYAGFRSIPSTNRIALSINQMRNTQPGVERLLALFRETGGSVPPVRGERTFRFEETIVLRDVTMRYPGAASAALSGVSLTIHKGEMIGIVGANGSGKSTLLDLLAGILSPTAGTIDIDGRPQSEWLALSPPLAGYVPQTTFLLDASIEHNIAFGVPVPMIDAAAVERAARITQLEDLMGDSARVTVGEQGRLLSGGQRQRVAIARALYDDPEIVILDEATSALDSDVERRVMAAIAETRGAKTILMATQDVEATRSCDRIIVLENGTIAGVGRYEELNTRHTCTGSFALFGAQDDTQDDRGVPRVILSVAKDPEALAADDGVTPARGTGR